MSEERAAAPSVVLVSVGDELLVGETVDTNQAWLGRELTRTGLGVRAGLTVGDDDGEIRRAVAESLRRAEIVVVTGGLGPTPDDRTKEAVAGLLERELELRQDLYDALEARFREWGYESLPPANRSQAEVPRGAQVLPNPRGSAPGLILRVGDDAEGDDAEGRRMVVLLPGIPREVEGLFPGLERALEESLGGRLLPVHHRMIHTTGIPESVLSEAVVDALPDQTGPVSVAFLPRVTGVDLRLTARTATTPAEARAWLDRVEAALGPVVAEHRYDSPRGDLVDPVAEALIATGRRLAVAESCTGGLLAERLTERPGSSEYFLGGVVSYADASKVRDLGVAEELIQRHGAVSEPVVRAMVEGVVRRFGAEAGMAVTGIAGPGGGTREKPVGTVWYAVRVDGATRIRHTRFPGDRGSVRRRATQATLHLLLRTLLRGDRRP